MKRSILLFFWLLSTSLFAQNVEWAHSIGGSGRDQPQSIKSDQNGNVIVAGTFVGTPIYFSDSDIVLHGSDSTDIYLYKKSPSGELLWATVLTSAGHEHVNDIAVDSEGNVFIAGWFRKPMTLGVEGNQITLTSSGGQDGFIAKYAPDGQLLLAYSLGGEAKDEFLTISFDHEDNLVLSGRFFHNLDFDFSEDTHIENPNGLTFLKLTTDLEFISVTVFDMNQVFPTSVGCTAQGDMVFAGGRGISMAEGFVYKVNNNNELLWSVVINGPVFQMVNDMHISQTGEIYIAGEFTKSTMFSSNSNNYVFQSDSESRDVFFAKLSSEGVFEWIKVIGGSAFDEVSGIEADSHGNIILVGRYSGTMDFDPSLGTVELTPQGNASSYVAIYTADGAYMDVHSFQNSSYNSASGIALSPTNELYVTGWFTENINFDSNQSGLSFYSHGMQDTYLVKLDAMVVGLNESHHKPEISIFPNPANDQVNIEAENLDKMQLFDIHGKLVLSKSSGFRQNNNTLTVSHLPAGIYFIRLSVNNHIPFSEKLVIIR